MLLQLHSHIHKCYSPFKLTHSIPLLGSCYNQRVIFPNLIHTLRQPRLSSTNRLMEMGRGSLALSHCLWLPLLRSSSPFPSNALKKTNLFQFEMDKPPPHTPVPFKLLKMLWIIRVSWRLPLPIFSIGSSQAFRPVWSELLTADFHTKKTLQFQ